MNSVIRASTLFILNWVNSPTVFVLTISSRRHLVYSSASYVGIKMTCYDVCWFLPVEHWLGILDYVKLQWLLPKTAPKIDVNYLLCKLQWLLIWLPKTDVNYFVNYSDCCPKVMGRKCTCTLTIRRGGSLLDGFTVGSSTNRVIWLIFCWDK